VGLRTSLDALKVVYEDRIELNFKIQAGWCSGTLDVFKWVVSQFAG